MRTGRVAAAAALLLSCAAQPALAATVFAEGGIGTFDIGDVGSPDDPTVSFDPSTSVEFLGGAPINASVSLSAPGSASDFASGAGTITNLLDQTISIVLSYTFDLAAVGTVESALEEVSAEGAFNLFVDGVQLDAGLLQASIPLGSCTDPECFEENLDYGGFAVGFDVAANATASLTYTSSAEVELIAPVPLPATAGFLLAALGGLGVRQPPPVASSRNAVSTSAS